MKGIILAGGLGTRLWSVTQLLNKHLLPVYDKPMIYYPISTLMLAGIRDIAIISSPNQLPSFQALLGSGVQWGLRFTYLAQERPEGIAQAFLIAEKFIGKDAVSLILGDNFFHGSGIEARFKTAVMQKTGATIFIYYVNNPNQYCVAEFDKNGLVISLEEKPKIPKSNYAISGLYFYDNHVIDFAKAIKPSARGELEITDINLMYLKYSVLKVETLGRGTAWLDMGTHDSLLAASNYVHVVENRQGLKVGCPEEIAWRLKYISDEQLEYLIARHPASAYSKYLQVQLEESRYAIPA